MNAAVLILFFLSGCCRTSIEALTVNGKVGETVRIKCSHANAVTNVKYFCKGKCRKQDVLISSRPRTRELDRYSIEDKGNTFITTIRDLRPKDTGIYWCGIDRVGFDTYVKVDLKVNNVVKSDVHTVKETTTETTTEIKPTERPKDFENESPQGERIAGNLSYLLTHIGATLGVAVLVLALVLLIFCRLKRRRTALPSDKNQGTNEYLEDQRRNGPLPASLTNPHPDSSMYSNVIGFPKPQDQPDESVSVPSSPEQPGVFYSTVNFNYGSTGVALITDTESVMYCTIKMTQEGPAVSDQK